MKCFSQKLIAQFTDKSSLLNLFMLALLTMIFSIYIFCYLFYVNLKFIYAEIIFFASKKKQQRNHSKFTTQ